MTILFQSLSDLVQHWTLNISVNVRLSLTYKVKGLSKCRRQMYVVYTHHLFICKLAVHTIPHIRLHVLS